MTTENPALPKRFQPIRVLGQGGMGVVYEAFDEERGERVAVKTMLGTAVQHFARFKNEFRVLREIRHPNLVRLGDLVSEGDLWCFSMELVGGVDLLEWVRLLPADQFPSTRRPSSDADTVVQQGPISNGPVSVSVRSPSPTDSARLKGAMLQLASALGALHAAGLVHRDVKPSNVLVTPEGRVVLLDFGIALDINALASMADIAGTPIYMAPEQGVDGRVGPAADWYAFGVLMFEALVGEPPFNGSALSVLMEKQRTDGPAPSTRVPNVPPDLDRLVAALLRCDPAQRPSEAEIRATLAASMTSSGEIPVAVAVPTPKLFIGREQECRELSDALALVRERSEPRAVFIQGESGVGKTALVNQFLAGLAREDRTALVLRGWCYPREDVPFRALDGVIDTLAKHLARMATQAQAMLPRRSGLLALLFPVLRRIPAIARDAASEHLASLDPGEARNLATLALRELLGKLAQQHAVVITIDDAQWSDPDSQTMLSRVLEAPDAPPILVIATQRAAAETSRTYEVATLDNLGFQLPVASTVIDLEPLPPRDASYLARALLDAAMQDRSFGRELVIEADGHPLFIDILVRYAVAHPNQQGRAPRFDEALAWRLSDLNDEERLVMNLIAITGAPVTLGTLRSASGATPAVVAHALDKLRDSQLVSLAGGRSRDSASIYHDRLRRAALTTLSDEQRRELHARLAAAIESADKDNVDALASHWAQAGDRPRAKKYRMLAADKAAAAFAFARAARLLSSMVEQGDVDDDNAVDVYRKLADALASVGKGRDAAHAYERAAALTTGLDAAQLRHRAAEQLLRSGHVEPGLNCLATLLSEYGERMPQTHFRALLWLVVLHAWLLVRGVGFSSERACVDAPRKSVQGRVAPFDVALVWTGGHSARRSSERHHVVARAATWVAHACGQGAFVVLRPSRLRWVDEARSVDENYLPKRAISWVIPGHPMTTR